MNLLNRSLCLIVCLFCTTVIAEPPQLNTEPDFYERPGSIEGRAYETSENLVVDTFSGALSFQSVDVNIPGTGPALQVIRNYNSVPTLVAPNLGIHYGSLIGDYWCSSDDVLHIQSDRLFYVDQNMTRHQLMVNTSLFIDNNGNKVFDEQSDYKPSHITMNFMRAECREQQLVITDKRNTDYYFSTEQSYRGLVTKIEDSYGNSIDITYELIQAYYRPVRAKASDGREIKFNYDAFKLDSVVAVGSIGNNTLVDYIYEGPNGRLSKVVLPEGLTWEYEYKSPTHLISHVKTPLGADVSIQWDNYFFHERDYPYVNQKCVDNKCWNYTYTRSISSGQDDQSTITTPWGTTEVYNYFSPLGVESDEIWKIGLLRSKQIKSSGAGGEVDNVYSNTTNNWEYILVENKTRTATFGLRNFQEFSYKKPVLKSQTVNEKGKTYTKNISNMTATGQPIKSVYRGNSTKTVNFTYANYGEKGGRWLLDLLSTKKTVLNYPMPESPLTTKNGLKRRENGEDFKVNQTEQSFLYDLIIDYNNKGSVETKTNRGISTRYEYDAKGNLILKEDAESNKTHYSNYYRGVPRNISYSDNTNVSNVVDSLGRVTTLFDQKGTPTTYEYDGLNRVVKVITPGSSDIVISYPSFREKVYQRGSLLQTYKFDKIGNLKELIKEDVVTGKRIITYYSYNERKQLSFKSYEGEEFKGINYYYDSLGNHTKSITTDGITIVKNEYDGEDVTVFDGENNATKLLHYTFFPGDKLIKQIQAPENVTIDIERNSIGLKTYVKQEGIEREYRYNSLGLLNYYNEPEEDGHYNYEYDLNGNMVKSIKVTAEEQFVTQIEYDSLGRKTSVVQPHYFKLESNNYVYRLPQECTSEAYEQCNYTRYRTEDSFVYDKIGNLKNAERKHINVNVLVTPYVKYEPWEVTTKWSYTYDNENNLLSEKMTHDNREFVLDYTYNSNNILSSVEYPDAQVVNYAPDAFGRPTRVGDYIDLVEYHDNGAVKSIQYANGIETTKTLDNRMLPKTVSISSHVSELLSLEYAYDNNQNILSIIDHVENLKTRDMTYDDLSRLETTTGKWGSSSFQYDLLGNIKAKSVAGRLYSYDYDEVTNRLSEFDGKEFSYNIFGQVESDGDNRYFYDPTGSLVKAFVGNDEHKISYAYDHSNRMVKRVEKGLSDYFAYASSGKLMYEEQNDGDLKRSHIYLGSKLVAYHDIKIECSDDLDNDGMGHCYEREHNLDPYSDSDAFGDEDNDGLTNLEEFNLGSSATNSDTDGDGMTDGFEVENSLNILINDAQLDADNDGFTNLEEFQQGTNPKVIDDLSKPMNIGALGSNDSILISWNNVLFATGYDLYWSYQPFTNLNDAELVQLSGNEYVHQLGSQNQSLYYRVVTRKDDKRSEASEIISAYTGDPTWQYQFKLNGTVRVVQHDNNGNVFLIKRKSETESSKILYFDKGATTPVEHELFDFYPYQLESEIADDGTFAIVAANSSTGSTWAAVYSAESQQLNVTKLKQASGSFQPKTGVKIASSSRGNFVATWTEENFSQKVRFVSKWEKSSGWSTPIALAYEESTAWSNGLAGDNVSLTINDNADIAVVWELQRVIDGNPGIKEAHLFTSSSTGASQKMVLGDVDYLSGFSVALNQQGNGLAVWEQKNPANRSINYIKFLIDGSSTESSSITSLDQSGADLWAHVGADDSVVFMSHQGSTRVFNKSSGLPWQSAGTLERTVSNSTIKKIVDGSYHLLTYKWFEQTQSSNYQVNRYFDGEIETLLEYGTGKIFTHSNFSQVGAIARLDNPVNGEEHSVFTIDNKPRAENQLPNATATGSLNYEGDADDWVLSLSGLNSNDPDGIITNFEWAQVSGPSVRLHTPNGYTTRFDVPTVDTATLVFELTVTDDRGGIATDRVTLEHSNPYADAVANAGSDQRVEESVTVQLSGDNSTSGSQNPIIEYQWRQVSGPSVTLSDTSVSNVSFTTPDVTGTTNLVFELEVMGQNDLTDSDRVTITVVDYQPPVANAGDDQTVDAGDRVVLDFSNSYDPDGGSISMNIGTVSGGYVQLEQGSQSGTLEFTAPDVSSDTTYVFRLTVTDDEGDTATDDVAVTVRAPVVAEKPVANAGSNQTMDEGTTVTLDGSASTISGGETITGYNWTQLSGPTVSLNNSASVAPQFTAPDVGESTQLQFQLTVTASNGETDQSTVIITITDTSGNLPPVANAGDDQTVNEGDTVILDARASNDPDGSSLNMSWRVVSGGNVNLQQGPEQGTLQFTAPSVGIDTDYVFEVTVTDAAGATASDQVSITVLNTDAPPSSGQCELDFDGNGIVEQKDFYTNNYEGIYYAVYIYLNYPSYYNYYFPNTPEEKLDWNGDGNITIEEVYTGTISEQTKETYQTQHYMYMNNKNTYANWYPNSGCAL